MIDTTDHEEHDHPVRKILRSLPKVDSPEDFENRLERRIAEDEAVSHSFLDLIIQPRRIPVYAFSAITMAIVGVFAYYVFVQTNVVPEPVLEQQKTVEQPAVPEPGQAQTAGRSDEHLRPAQRVVATDSARPEEMRMTSQRESVGGDIDRRGLLREVGGTGLQRTQQSPDMPFLRTTPGTDAGYSWMDSVARVDSLRRDSLKRAGERQ